MVVGRVLGIPFLRAQASGGFDGDFAALGDCELWFDGKDASTQWQDAAGTTGAGVGDTVQKWDDKSGNGNDVSRIQVIASISDSGLNSNRGVYGGGGMNVSSLTQGNVTGPYTWFIVAENATPATNNSTILDGIGATNRNVMLWTSSWARLRRLQDAQITPATGAGPSVYCYVVDGTSSTVYVDNVQSGTTYNDTLATCNGVTIGTNYIFGAPWPGYIGDIILYDGTFSLSARENISDLLAAKYGI